MHSKKDKSQLRKKKGEKTENITASSNRRGRGKPEKHRKTDLSNNFSRGEIKRNFRKTRFRHFNFETSLIWLSDTTQKREEKRRCHHPL